MCIFSQVTDPLDGWVDFRPFHTETWTHFAIAHKCIFLWSSATCNDCTATRICGAFDILRENLFVLQMDGDRPNIFHQRRIASRTLSIGWGLLVLL